MPYENEFAHYKPLQRIANSETVKNLLGRMRTDTPKVSIAPLHSVSLTELNAPNWLPDFVLTVDGSMAEIPVKNGYPSSQLGYITVASVLLDVAKMNILDKQRPIDPREFRTLEQAEAIDGVLPGCNVIIEDQMSAVDSFRLALWELFKSRKFSEESESILETYEALLQYKPKDKPPKGQRCPYEDCIHPEPFFERKTGKYTCSCLFHRPLYSTDALRIHEFMNPEGSNQSVLTETMTVLERVWMVHVLRALEKTEALRVLRSVAFVLDGPLAVFGAPAWISTAIMQELRRINLVARKVLNDANFNLMLIGIEKSGSFVDHLEQLDKGENGQGDALPRQSAILLSDTYIKQRIIFSKSPQPYGHNTYFGRKAFYKTASGSLIVFSTPFLEEKHQNLETTEPTQFPRLADVMRLLDKMASARYQNSLTNIISAHAEAAIPLTLGKKVLERLAHRLIKTV